MSSIHVVKLSRKITKYVGEYYHFRRVNASVLEIYSDEYFMKMAIAEARLAAEDNEVPVGAVLVAQNKIIARAHNLTERLTDVTAHAEMQAITAGAAALGSKYLWDCTLYITLEPCVMCAGALYWSQVSRVVYGASDPKRGYHASALSLHPKTEVVSGVMADACSELITEFFRSKRG